MTTSQRLLYALCMAVALSSTALAQKKPLPGDLTQNSSVLEIVAWLDQTTFRNAGIRLTDSWEDDDSTYCPPWLDCQPPETTFNFTRGFRVTTIDNCNLILRNDDVKTVKDSKLEDSPSHLVADVWVQLNRMSPTKGSHTHRYTSDRDKARLLGAWRTEFKYKGLSSKTIVELKLNSPEWKERQRWQSTNIAFTFDTKEMSENFDAAFRQAIRLCRSK